MANYRPKSLNELNNLYDKSIAAQNAIKSSGSAITDSDFTKSTAFQAPAEDLQAAEKTAAQIASDELADALSDFKKNFGESTAAAPAERPTVRQPLPIKKAVKSVPAANAKVDRGAEHPVSRVDTTKSAQQEEPSVKKEKPVLMRNAERSELLDDYMKIMNDEDDDIEFLKSIVKKKKKNKKDKHQGSPLEQESAAEESADIPEEQPEELAEAQQEEIQEFPDAQENEDEVFGAFYKEEGTQELPEQEQPEQTQKKPVKKGRKIVLQLILMLVLLVVLFTATAVGLLKVVVGVDSGTPFMDQYYVFTADKNYTEAGIAQGDLVITKTKEINESEAFAYMESGFEKAAYAVKSIEIDENRFMARCDNEVELVMVSSVKGAVEKAIPSVGSVVALVTENFIIVIAALVVIALILILVLALAFRSKPAVYEIDAEDSQESEDEDEADDEQEQEEEYYDEDEAEEEYSSDSDNLFSSID